MAGFLNRILGKSVKEYGNELKEAAETNNLEQVKSILKACPRCINEKDGAGYTALIIATNKEHTEIVKELINAGANLEGKTKDGWVALIFAAREGHTEIVKELINAGVKLDEKNNNGSTALMFAAYWGRIDVLEVLLAAGADITIVDKNGSTAIEDAAESNFKEGCIALLQEVEKGIRPTCEEVGILPPKERMTKAKREQRWQDRISASANEKGGNGMEIE